MSVCILIVDTAHIMKKYILLFALILVSPLIFAEVAQKIFPAVWAWEISGKGRTIYLLGELHSFSGTKDDKVDYELANSIYDLSETVWIESSVTKSNKNSDGKKLSERLQPATWIRIKNSLEKSVNDILNKKTQSEKTDFYQKIVKENDEQSAAQSYIGLLQIASVQYRLLNRKEKLLSGFNFYMRDKESKSNIKKSRELENQTIADDQWRKLCDTDENAEKLMLEALSYLESNPEITFEKVRAAQNIFVDPKSTLDEIDGISIGSGSALFKKCNIQPRNRVWLPIMLNALETSGPPVTFDVGISHIAGQEGLLELLRKEGYKNIRRIYTVK
jgi:uncharacterized protein YbaP (TraB family)